MCGIAGIVRFDRAPVSIDELRLMTDAIEHRGPDDEGFWCAPGIGLGMRRLSIIDLATGHQPIANEDGTVWVVCNGEIYNFQALRARARGRGPRLLVRQRHRGHRPPLRGAGRRAASSACAACSRSRCGTRARALAPDRARPARHQAAVLRRPTRGGVRFGSELKAILALEAESPRLDWAAVDHLLRHLTTPARAEHRRGRAQARARALPRGDGRRSVAVRRCWRVAVRARLRQDARSSGSRSCARRSTSRCACTC